MPGIGAAIGLLNKIWCALKPAVKAAIVEPVTVESGAYCTKRLGLVYAAFALAVLEMMIWFDECHDSLG